MAARARKRRRPKSGRQMDEARQPSPRYLYVLFLLSGLASLIYELMWMRSFSLVFGSTSEATAAVLAAFFAGLALGSWVGARLSGPRSLALRRYGIAEFGIAVGAMLVPVWIWLYRDAYATLYEWASGHGWKLTAVKLALAFVAMGLPCVSMGATLPLISRALVGTTGHFGRRVGVAYAMNTLGATAGVVLAGFVLPIQLGTTNTVFLAAAINIVVGVMAIALSRRVCREPDDVPGTDEAGVSKGRPPRDPGLLVVVAASGFGTLALEVLFARLIINFTDSCAFSFALMLSTFLVFLALASFVVSVTIDGVRRPWRFLAWTQTLAVIPMLAAPAVFQALFDRTDFERIGETLGVYLFKLVLRSIVVMGPTVLLIGVALPIAWRIATRAASASGRNVGRLTGLNTLAAVAGSVGTGFVIIPWIGVGKGIVLVAALYGVVSVVSWQRGYGRKPALMAGGGLIGLFVALSMGTNWSTEPVRVPEGHKLVYLAEGKSVTVAITEGPGGSRVMKVNNGYTLGGSGRTAIEVQRSEGGLPLMLHPSPKKVAFIGVGTGISVSSVLDFPVERVLAIELFPEVMEAAVYFEEANQRVLHDARVEAVVADGRNHLFASPERFDIIVGDIFSPWRAGTGYLYTSEHFQSVADHLEEGGIFVQWLPGHQLTVDDVRMIVATFQDVFPSTTMWLDIPSPRWPILGLVGHADPEAMPTQADRQRVETSTAFRHLRYVCSRVALERWAGSAPRNSDEFPLVEYGAAVAGRFNRGENLNALHQELEALRLGRRTP